jgi:protein gp37
MGTKIEWCDESWNVVTGCSPVSEGCENCYAERMAKRLAGRCGYPKDNPFAVTWHKTKEFFPGKFRNHRRIFVNSMGDLFHPDAPAAWVQRVWELMKAYSQHTFLVLTKRPENIASKLGADDPMVGWWFESGPQGEMMPSNIWLGVTAENQRTADERIPILLQIPASVRFVSCEPLLGPIDLTGIQFDKWTTMNVLEGCGISNRPGYGGQMIPNVSCKPLDWIVTGGETGPGARECNPQWITGLWEQCQYSDVPFFFKSWGNSMIIEHDIRYGDYGETYCYTHGESCVNIVCDEITATRQFPFERGLKQ